MKKDENTDKNAISDALSDFMKAAAVMPNGGPLQELFEKFADKKERETGIHPDPTFLCPGSNRFEWMVEVQIRQWNLSQKDHKNPPAPPRK